VHLSRVETATNETCLPVIEYIEKFEVAGRPVK